MALAAVSRIDDALDETRRFLFPFATGRWLRLAVLALFVGVSGGSGFSSGGGQAPMAGQPMPGDGGEFTLEFGDVAAELGVDPAVLLAGVGTLVLVALAFALLSSVLEFAFVDAVRVDHVANADPGAGAGGGDSGGPGRGDGPGTGGGPGDAAGDGPPDRNESPDAASAGDWVRGDLSLRRVTAGHLGRGVGLFLFRLAVALLLLGPGLLLAWALLRDGIALGEILLLAPVFVVGGLVLAVVDRLTVSLVVPVAIARETGILAAWRSFWSVLRDELVEVAVFLVLDFVLTVVAGAIRSIVTGILIAVVAVPVVLVAVVLGVGGVTVSPLALLLGVPLALLVVLYALVVAGLVAVPFEVYLRYYSLLVLGEIAPEYDLLPGRPAA